MQELEGIRTLLENVRQGNLLKNIELFMACYSPSFKDREGKRGKRSRPGEISITVTSPMILETARFQAAMPMRELSGVSHFFLKTGGPARRANPSWRSDSKEREDGWKIAEVKPVGLRLESPRPRISVSPHLPILFSPCLFPLSPYLLVPHSPRLIILTSLQEDAYEGEK